ncbi:MAG TPA: ABC transporter substrate-binding protein [Stellaceae bacterium]|nr:ABC transporter substrate-binding protein [Stellaceae bacterium]
MRRREVIASLAGLATWPVVARGQEPGRVYRVAYLGPSPIGATPQAAFFEALAKRGFVEGKNLEADKRGYGQRPGQFAETARALVQAKVDLIVCGGPEPGKAAQAATKTIPILVNTDDMMGEGLVKSIAHPEANVTGISIRSPDLDGKRLEILLELLPAARRIAGLAGGDTANPQHFGELRDAAKARGVEFVIRTVDAYGEIAPAIEAAKAAGARGLNVMGSALLFGNRKAIFERTAALGLPAIYQWPENAREGGFVGYGPSIVEIYRAQISRLAVKILLGAKPADLPVELPDKFDLAINLKVAKALGLTVPQVMLAKADEVVE